MSLSLSVVGNSLKYSTLGVMLGVGVGTVTEVAADELIAMLDIRKEEHLTSALAELLVRAAVAGVSAMASAQVLSGLNTNMDDATDGALYSVGFMSSQSELYASIVTVRNQIVASFHLKEPCCAGCANTGGSCKK